MLICSFPLFRYSLQFTIESYVFNASILILFASYCKAYTQRSQNIWSKKNRNIILKSAIYFLLNLVHSGTQANGNSTVDHKHCDRPTQVWVALKGKGKERKGREGKARQGSWNLAPRSFMKVGAWDYKLLWNTWMARLNFTEKARSTSELNFAFESLAATAKNMDWYVGMHDVSYSSLNFTNRWCSFSATWADENNIGQSYYRLCQQRTRMGGCAHI